MLSPVATFLVDQLTSIKNTSLAPANYRNNFENITSGIIPSINNQLKRYEDNALEAIKTEVLEELTTDEYVKELKSQVMNDLKTGQVNRLERIESKPRCTFKITMIDISKLAQPGSDLNEMHDHFSVVISDLRRFEDQMCSYKQELKRYIQSCIPNMIANYESTVRSSWKNKSEFPKLKEYLESKINHIMDN